MTETAITSNSGNQSGKGGRQRSAAEEEAAEVQMTVQALASAEEEAQKAALEQAVHQIREQLREQHNGSSAHQLVSSARQQLVAQLADLDQKHAREQLLAATRSSEEAAASAVQGVATIIRLVIPTGVTHPEQVIDTTFGLAEQSLHVLQRLAHEVVGAARELVAA